jgi:hypothetical protein
MSWIGILRKRNVNILNVFNVSKLVREATREWADTVPIGSHFFTHNIREGIIPFLEPKIKALLKTEHPERRTGHATTIFINAHFRGLKMAERSKYDITMFNVLMKHPNWIVKGKSPAAGDYKKVE